MLEQLKRASAALGLWLIRHESAVIFVVLEGCVGVMFWAMR